MNRPIRRRRRRRPWKRREIYRPYVPQPRAPEPPPVRIRYCDACGMAISESGACRC